ncbi:hypothetical protein ABTX85_36400 [Streptomyces sp. NPDC096097]|uniref:TRADD-N-associated membrane domain-containing protein n=1 Tax=Streptomyces sp. NPDC096097 TaxID=3155546 RepID=UPI003331CD65
MDRVGPKNHDYADDREARLAALAQGNHERELAALNNQRVGTALIALVVVTLATMITLSATVLRKSGGGIDGWLPAILTTTGIAALGGSVAAVVLRDRRREQIRQETSERLDSAARDLRDRMELASLVNYNRVLLDQYHGIATKQANKSFNSSLGAMIVGLAVLVAAFYASMQFTAAGERIFIGSLAALSTVFVGYLSKTFIAVYDRSLQQLNQYFNQPVLNQYFLSAERIVERINPNLRDELHAEIVRDILATGKQMHAAAVTPTAPAAPAAPRRHKAPAQPVPAQQPPAP